MSQQKDKIDIIKTVSAEQNKKLTKQKTKEVYAREKKMSRWNKISGHRKVSREVRSRIVSRGQGSRRCAQETDEQVE